MLADSARGAFVSREPNKGMQSSPFRLQPTATVIHNVPKRRPDFITLNQYSRRNQSCENQILLFLLKTKLVSVSPLNYTIGGVCHFFSLLDFFTIFYDFFISFGHDFAIAAIQFAYASYLFDIYLPTDSRNYDYGRWP